MCFPGFIRDIPFLFHCCQHLQMFAKETDVGSLCGWWANWQWGASLPGLLCLALLYLALTSQRHSWQFVSFGKQGRQYWNSKYVVGGWLETLGGNKKRFWLGVGTQCSLRSLPTQPLLRRVGSMVGWFHGGLILWCSMTWFYDVGKWNPILSVMSQSWRTMSLLKQYVLLMFRAVCPCLVLPSELQPWAASCTPCSCEKGGLSLDKETSPS